MATSGPFCIERAGKKYTRAEIESWTFSWQGKSGPAMTHRGGYNCRHHWMPLSPDWTRAKGEKKPKPMTAVGRMGHNMPDVGMNGRGTNPHEHVVIPDHRPVDLSKPENIVG